jgi:WD40 repeat protein/serine/threonine protein kinase
MRDPNDHRWNRYADLVEELAALSADARNLELCRRADAGEDPELLDKVREFFHTRELTTWPWTTDFPRATLYPGLKVGEWKLERSLGRGGMGEVWKARKIVFFEGQESILYGALKFIRPSPPREDVNDRHKRFAGEVHNLLKVHDHQNICSVYDPGIHIDSGTGLSMPYFAMNYLKDAKPLTAYVRENSLPMREWLDLFMQVCAAIYHAHEKDVLHLDLKPGNILVDHLGCPYVVDFGLAKIYSPSLSPVSPPTFVAGTIGYMSPEQEDPARFGLPDKRSDQYALGVVLYELCSGKVPFRNAAHVTDLSFDQAMDAIAELGLREILRKALAIRTEGRFPHVRALKASIERFHGSLPIVLSGIVTPPDQARSPMDEAYGSPQPPEQGFPRSSVFRFRVAFALNTSFVGRDSELAQLHGDLCRARQAKYRPVGLHGFRGIGKTQMALQYAYRFQFAYPDGVFWADATNGVEDGLGALGADLRPEYGGRSKHERVCAAVAEMEQRPGALLIIDNVVDLMGLSKKVPGGMAPAALPCQILFTTWHRKLDPFQAVEVKLLPRQAAVRLLLPESDPRRAEIKELEEANIICARLGDLALLVTIAASNLSERPETSAREYRKELESRGVLEVLGDVDNPDAWYEPRVTAVLANQWDILGDDAREVLCVAGQLPESARIPAARLGLLAGLRDDNKSFNSPLQRALNDLHKARLVEKVESNSRYECVWLHTLVRVFANAQTPSEEASSFRSKCARNLIAAYENFHFLERQWGSRDPAELQEDLDAAGDLLSNTSNAPPSHLELESRRDALIGLIQREGANLRGWDKDHHPQLLAQQVHNLVRHMRSNQLVADLVVDAGLERLAQGARLRLSELSCPYFELCWSTGHSREFVHTLTGHQGSVNTVAVTSEGRVVSGSGDCTLKVWDLNNGEVVTLRGHSKAVWPVALTRDGRAISGSDDHHIVVWNLATGLAICSSDDQGCWVNAVAVSPNGRCVISGDDNGTIKVWDLEPERLLLRQSLPGAHMGWIIALTITPDGKWFLSGSQDEKLKVWDLDTLQVRHTLEGHRGWVRGVAATSDGRHAVSVSTDTTIKIWDLETGKAERTLVGHSAWVRGLVILPGDTRIVSASDDGTLKVWDLFTGKELRTLCGHVDRVRSVAVTPDGHSLITGSADRTLKIWELEKGDDVGEGGACGVVALAVTPDGRHALSAASDGILMLYDTAMGKVIRSVGRCERPPRCAAVSPSRTVILTFDNGTVEEWDLEVRMKVRTHPGPETDARALALAIDGTSIASYFADHTVRLQDRTSGEVRVLAERPGLGHAVAAAITPTGSHAVFATRGGRLEVWSPSTGQSHRPLAGHECEVRAVALTMDGCLAFSTAMDRQLKVWDVHTGKELANATLTVPLNCIAVTPDGGTVLVGDIAGGIYCFRVEGLKN